MTESDYKRLLNHATWEISRLRHELDFLRKQNAKLHDDVTDLRKRIVRVPLKRVPQ